jgi:hypothetical protein
MTVLVACEFSGTVRDAFIANKIDAVSADLLPTESAGPHIQGDVTSLLKKKWRMVIAHPPCTRLANSGVRWLHERNLWKELEQAARFFRACLDANAPLVAVENPVMHKHAVELIGRKHSFTIQPWQFGEPFTNRTCVWCANLPPLRPVKIVRTRKAQCHLESPGKLRWKKRSSTYPGIAKAIADQWGALL